MNPILTQHSSCQVPPTFLTAKLPERTGSSLSKWSLTRKQRTTIWNLPAVRLDSQPAAKVTKHGRKLIRLVASTFSQAVLVLLHVELMTPHLDVWTYKGALVQWAHLLPRLLQPESCSGKEVELRSCEPLLSCYIVIILLWIETWLSQKYRVKTQVQCQWRHLVRMIPKSFDNPLANRLGQGLCALNETCSAPNLKSECLFW